MTSRRTAISDDLLGWRGLALALLAAIVLDKRSPPHKWHAAIMWTFVAFFGVLIFGRQQRNSWRFWSWWVVCLIGHGFVMWALFAQLFPGLLLGTVYVVPLAIVESIFLTVLILKVVGRTAERFAAQPEGRQ